MDTVRTYKGPVLASALGLIIGLACNACAGGDNRRGEVSSPDTSWSHRIADSFLARHPGAVTYDTGAPSQKWNYEQGFMLVALVRMWQHSGDEKYFEFVQKNLDRYVRDDGSIATYVAGDYRLDDIGPGRALLAIYNKTHEQKYRAAADLLRQQLHDQPRTHEGGFWHKKIYPYQMWLDGLFMAQPFAAQYASLFGESDAFDGVADQFLWMERHARDSATGLLYHGWDESKQQRWANPVTGCSPSFWGRAIGWYALALVDVLEDFPPAHPKRQELASVLRDLAAALLHYQDPQTHLWYQVVDQRSRAGNYPEASASCMFAYAFARGVHDGILDRKYLAVARETFDGVVAHFVTIDASGAVDLNGICRGAGLGGTPYRDGSFEYYISEPTRTNDMKGIGAFLLAAIELEQATTADDIAK